MSDRQANMRGWAAYAGILLTLLTSLAWGSMRVGELLHEVRGIREDMNDIKIQVSEDRREVKEALKEIGKSHRELERRVEEALKEIGKSHRELERRVEILEVHDSVLTPRGIK